mmetsp:Transcript_2116/g.5864  ORF Transcript_2116/g.5864 Transcript_2116/m.5864 type:complete len:270 (-) Transcript_2116:46-855(-)
MPRLGLILLQRCQNLGILAPRLLLAHVIQHLRDAHQMLTIGQKVRALRPVRRRLHRRLPSHLLQRPPDGRLHDGIRELVRPLQLSRGHGGRIGLLLLGRRCRRLLLLLLCHRHLLVHRRGTQNGLLVRHQRLLDIMQLAIVIVRAKELQHLPAVGKALLGLGRHVQLGRGVQKRILLLVADVIALPVLHGPSVGGLQHGPDVEMEQLQVDPLQPGGHILVRGEARHLLSLAAAAASCGRSHLVVNIVIVVAIIVIAIVAVVFTVIVTVA